MLELLRKTIEQDCKYRPGEVLLVGVSGGPDSLALLHGLISLGYPVIAAHLDHGLRPESGEDRRFVADFCGRFGIDFVGLRIDTNEYVSKQKLSVEEAGRNLRYNFLFEQAKKLQASGVVVGHNADDQVETVLMHLLRGAGLDGLSGMGYVKKTAWHDQIPLLRPLLRVWRKEIEEYCRINAISPRFDRSNLDTTYFRNRIRHELVPELETYNPQIKQALWKTANTVSEDRDFLKETVKAIFQQSAKVDIKTREVAFERDAFLARPISVQRRLVRLGILSLRPDIRDIGFQEVQKVIAFVMEPSRGGSADLFQGLSIALDNDNFILFEGLERQPSLDALQLGENEVLDLQIPGEVVSETGWCFSARLVQLTGEIVTRVQQNPDSMTAYVDADTIEKALTLSPRKAGDRFAPLGMDGKRTKISDYMINMKLPKHLRKFWPLVYSRGEVVWIPGKQVSHDVRITDQTKAVIILTVCKNNQSE
ncbi:tRNA lysidine(34) synthetase TilS [bacterium]|nr:tRNA lysidine(34) synthetase TilS [bacterium]